jgi:putative endonuclease
MCSAKNPYGLRSMHLPCKVRIWQWFALMSRRLRSENFPGQTYVGSTSDLRKRLTEHNAGKSIHTNKFKPWNLMAYVALPEKLLAERFGK